jgi:hypothetical protein
MNKLVFLIAVTLLCPLTSAAAEVLKSVTKVDGITITPQNLHEEDQKLKYTVDANFPKINSQTSPEQATQFNQMLTDLVNKKVKQFEADVASDMPHMQNLPVALQKNNFSLHTSMDVIKVKNTILLSVLFTTDAMQAGQAHPSHIKDSINYNLTAGKVITLSELFKSDSHYLDSFASYSKKMLQKKLKGNDSMLDKGTAPDPKNYEDWNVKANGIKITFAEAQVAPYVFGPQQVTIPYSVLKDILSPDAVIISCAQDAKQCKTVA